VRRSLTVLADACEVRIADAGQILAYHPRSYDKGQQIEDEAHIRALVAQKRAGRRHRATDRLFIQASAHPRRCYARLAAGPGRPPHGTVHGAHGQVG